MHPNHLKYAQQSLSAFIYSAIQRHAYSGDFAYRFSIDEDDIRSALGLSRGIKSSVLADYVAYFEAKGVQATENMGSIDLVLNLNDVSLNPAQAEALNAALALFRTEHG